MDLLYSQTAITYPGVHVEEMTGAPISIFVSPALAQLQVAGMSACFKHRVNLRLSVPDKVAIENVPPCPLPAEYGCITPPP